MATHYIEEFDSTAAFLARSADRSNKLGIGSVGEVLYMNKAGAAVKIQDQGIAAKAPSVAYAADGAIAPTAGIAKLTKAGVGAYTLAAPTAAQEGTELIIVNGTANAHVVTATDLLDDGVTGGAKDTATFGAFVGACITLRAIGLTWYVVSKNVVTIAAV